MLFSEEYYKLYDYLIDYEIATAEEIDLVEWFIGHGQLETLEDILYKRTGYRSLEQITEEY